MDNADAKPEEAKAADAGGNDDSEEESGEDDRDPEQLKIELLAACRENN